LKEKLYTIPVNEAFLTDSECPLCSMRKKLETDAIEYTLGPSYMEDDIRGMTSKLGFCEKHLEQLYQNQNRLGLALILKTHMDKVLSDIEKHLEADSKMDSKATAPSLFRKKAEAPAVVNYLNELDHSCFVCDRINNTFQRYVATLFYLYHHDKEFKNKIKNSKGFCTSHYRLLYSAASEHLRGEELKEFLQILNVSYLENMKRVRDDLEWFINKFDYRYTDAPWKNAKDALPRAMLKTNGIVEAKLS
jgi:hypothetical protein